jgi:thiamine-monophosphate kinase
VPSAKRGSAEGRRAGKAARGLDLKILGEFGLIDWIRRQVDEGRPASQGAVVLRGIGDDAAELWLKAEGARGRPRALVVTKDLLLEGIHFERRYHPPRLLGRKALAVNLSDIAAMGARPLAAFLGLAIPPRLPGADLGACLRGFLDLAAATGTRLAGGDTTASRSGLVLSVTLVGLAAPGGPIRRAGARPGDRLYVTGTLGDSALGLRLLARGRRLPGARGAEATLLRRHLDPTPRLVEGGAIGARRLASAMIDVSDGLAADLGHLCEESGVGARVDLPRLPRSRAYRSLVARLAPEDPLAPAVGGGEDYEILFAVSPERVPALERAARGWPARPTTIGEVRPRREGLVLLDDAGRPYRPRRTGFAHF